VFHADTLEAAVAAADRRYAAGEVIVLSPGAPSFPRFRSFEERGERFRASIAAAGGGQG
jgi:UDP-N-acetylmuramoylalanine--D-glutamate ligase